MLLFLLSSFAAITWLAVLRFSGAIAGLVAALSRVVELMALAVMISVTTVLLRLSALATLLAALPRGPMWLAFWLLRELS